MVRYPRDDVAHDYPTGWLRAPADNSLSFVHEGFWDELAVAAWQVEKVWVVADVGPIILNPTTAEAQVEA